MQRRNFLKITGATGVAIAVNPSMIGQTLFAKDGALFKRYARVQLVDEKGDPLTIGQLEVGKNYVFNYPHAGTSCLLVNLPEATAQEVELADDFGNAYVWKGGVGAKRTVVAYSGICPHQLTHINKHESFITYRQKGQRFEGNIVCDGHTSVYDPAKGCKVISGKSPAAFASIVLEVGDDDSLWAVGVLGKEKFHAFFRSFRRELKEQFGSKRKAKAKVSVAVKTMPMHEYTQDVIIL